MTAVAEQRQPVYDRFGMPHPGRDFVRTERIYFPLARDGETVDMILILNSYPDELETSVQQVKAALRQGTGVSINDARNPTPVVEI
jgi:hypothetical protein